MGNKPGQGALFKNDKQGNESRPDYRGTVNVEGTDYTIAAWIKTSKKGTKYMSLSVQPEQRRQQRHESTPEFDDKMPW